MARPRATEEQREAQRQRIRDAAREIYESAGAECVSIRRVAARAGVSQGTIYSYFTDRSELLRSLWLEPVQEASRELERVAEEISDPVERIRALLTGYVDFALGHPDVHRGAMLFVRPSSSPRPEVGPPESLPFYRLVRQAVTEVEESAGLPLQDPDRSVELLWAAIHGALGLAINTDIFRVSKAEVLGPEMVEMLMRSVVGPRPL
ncbi:MAG: TetR/AcrR family transcriptional regulator [Actinomycetota bacterium]